MRCIIGVDCDGQACVVGEPGLPMNDSSDYAFARRQATREADAAAKALLDGGAEQVIVWDNHGAGANLEFDRLDPRCEIALGAGFGRRWPGLTEQFDAVVMIGYHAMEGTPDGVLAHTYSPPAYRWIKANGQEVGEMALDAAVAGAFGVPLIFVASDEAGCEEARRQMPWVETVATKRGRGRHCAFSKHPTRAAEEIGAGVRRAVERLGEMQPFRFESPVEVEIRYKRLHQALKARILRRTWRLAGAMTLRRTFENFRDWSC
jgi:D-amino peptidase